MGVSFDDLERFANAQKRVAWRCSCGTETYAMLLDGNRYLVAPHIPPNEPFSCPHSKEEVHPEDGTEPWTAIRAKWTTNSEEQRSSKMKIAVIGGDDRIHRADLPEGCRTYTGDEGKKLVEVARNGTINGVIVLTKWMHGKLRDNIKQLPSNIPVAYFPHSINTLEDEIESLIEQKFPAPPVPVKKPFNPPKLPAPVLRLIEQARQEAPPAPTQSPATPPPTERGESAMPAASPPTAPPARKIVVAGVEVTPWNEEESEALRIARTNDLSAPWVDVQKAFVSLGGNPQRSVPALQQKWNHLSSESKPKAPQRPAAAKPASKAPPKAPSTPKAAPAAPASNGVQKTINLRSGGHLTLQATLNIFDLNQRDRELVFSLIDAMQEYEKREAGA